MIILDDLGTVNTSASPFKVTRKSSIGSQKMSFGKLYFILYH